MRSQARWLVPPFLAALLVRPAAASAQGSLVLGVETSAAAVASDAAVADRQFLVRVIPELQAGHTLPRGWRVDTTVAVTGSVRAVYDGTARGSSTEDASLHRAWVRLASTHFEARVGRQRISFGSASLFRPLMWFDRVDARDPTQVQRGCLRGAGQVCDDREYELLWLGDVRQRRSARVGRDADRVGQARVRRTGAVQDAQGRCRGHLSSPAGRYRRIRRRPHTWRRSRAGRSGCVGRNGRDTGRRGSHRPRRQVGFSTSACGSRPSPPGATAASSRTDGGGR